MVYKLSSNQMQWMDGLCWESHMYVRTTITIVARLIIKLPIPSFRSNVYNAECMVYSVKGHCEGLSALNAASQATSENSAVTFVHLLPRLAFILLA